MSALFDKLMKEENKEDIEFVEHLVTPVTPYLLCNHFYSTEVHRGNYKFIDIDLSIEANDLLQNKNYETVQNYDIVQVQVEHFAEFVNDVLPKLNSSIILITSQRHYPALTDCEATQLCLGSSKIIHWYAQNPIYDSHPKYSPFPYGFDHHKVDLYAAFYRDIVNNRRSLYTKGDSVYNSHFGLNPCIPTWHIRYDCLFDDVREQKIGYFDYLKNLLNSQFVISTTGDRDDCYRHYECIGLDAIPISNVAETYKGLFGSNMKYGGIEEMRNIVNGTTFPTYRIPEKDFLTVEFWRRKIKQTVLDAVSDRFDKHQLTNKVLGGQIFISSTYTNNKHIQLAREIQDISNIYVMDCFGDTFDIKQGCDKLSLVVTRTDVDGGWAQELIAYENRFTDDKIVIGRSNTQVAVITLPRPYRLGTKLRFSHMFSDTFEYMFVDNLLVVKRTDQESGWSQQLIGYIVQE